MGTLRGTNRNRLSRGTGMKVALVHDWLTGMRGGEKVLEIFCDLFPQADVFTLLHIPGQVSDRIEKHRIVTSFLQKFPSVETKYRYYLPLMPKAIESLDLSAYDLVISTSHCVAKGAVPRKDAVHVCCCFTPMRYIWDQYEHYFGPAASLPVRISMGMIRPYLQNWDVRSSARVQHFIAISDFVAGRIKRYYRRDSMVIYPPADTNYFSPSTENSPGEFYLIVSALAPYKRIDIAIEAFNRNKKPLKIIGSGQMETKLKLMAEPNIEFFGWLSNDEILRYYQNCKALIFPGIEDYGIVPVETMACGKPVIAFNEGGVTETVAEDKTGIFFDEQTPESLIEAVRHFEMMTWDSAEIRNHALKFSIDAYRKKIASTLRQIVPSIDLPSGI